jgi:tetratricopeptide (TPR) repeat protein
MNKEQYTQWMKNITDIPNTVSVESEIKKYPYCMLFHLFQSMKINSVEYHSVLAVLHPCREKLSALLSQRMENNYSDNNYKTKGNVQQRKTEEKDTIVKEVVEQHRNKEDLLEILQKRLAELNNESDMQKEKEPGEDSLYDAPPSVSLDELVEKFNKIPPVISFNPTDSGDKTNYKDLGKHSVTDRYNIVSETLAELYYSQGSYDKALKIYKALKRKYPEKSDTFAKIIEDINLKKNNTK